MCVFHVPINISWRKADAGSYSAAPVGAASKSASGTILYWCTCSKPP